MSTATPAAVPAALVGFKFPLQGSPGDLAVRVGLNLYYYPVKAKAARRWFVELMMNATTGFAGDSVDWVLNYFDGCNEPGWFEVAGIVLERHPELVTWAEEALS